MVQRARDPERSPAGRLAGSRRPPVRCAGTGAGAGTGARSVTLPDVRYFVDGDGRQHFNFAQQVWLDAAVQMAYTRSPTLALRTLAVNLLSMVITERNYRAAVGMTSRRALELASEFCRECLLNAPESGWELPRQTLRAWVLSRPRPARTR